MNLRENAKQIYHRIPYVAISTPEQYLVKHTSQRLMHD